MRLVPARKHVPLLATAAVCALLYAAAAVRYRNESFLSWPVLVNLFGDNAFLGLAAIGVTFVILSGGIDLSVGAVIGCTSIATAVLLSAPAEGHPAWLRGWHPVAVFPVLLAAGTLFGAGMGGVIQYFRLPPFLVTLAGMFLARGLASIISLESVTINHPWYATLSGWRIWEVPLTAWTFLGALLIAVYLAHLTRFGRNIYALGGSESAARLMGLPVGRTKVGAYALSGLCSSAAGLVYTVYMQSGNALAATGLELDAIACVVIGGTLLSGGVGSVFGTLLGVLIYGMIQTAITFEGTLSSWWTKIAVGALLLTFILLQKLVQRSAERRSGPAAAEGPTQAGRDTGDLR